MYPPNADANADGMRVNGGLTTLFDAVLQFRSDAPEDAVISGDSRDGAYIGTGDGLMTGERLRGTMTWSLYAGDCLYPRIRRGEAVPDDLHRCTLTLSGFIETEDGVQLRFDGRGYGLRSAVQYLWSATLAFRTEAPEYEWLTRSLAAMTGVFDEQAGRVAWRVFTTSPTAR